MLITVFGISASIIIGQDIRRFPYTTVLEAAGYSNKINKNNSLPIYYPKPQVSNYEHLIN